MQFLHTIGLVFFSVLPVFSDEPLNVPYKYNYLLSIMGNHGYF